MDLWKTRRGEEVAQWGGEETRGRRELKKRKMESVAV
jgi:hypothetical protein